MPCGVPRRARSERISPGHGVDRRWRRTDREGAPPRSTTGTGISLTTRVTVASSTAASAKLTTFLSSGEVSDELQAGSRCADAPCGEQVQEEARRPAVRDGDHGTNTDSFRTILQLAVFHLVSERRGIRVQRGPHLIPLHLVSACRLIMY